MQRQARWSIQERDRVALHKGVEQTGDPRVAHRFMHQPVSTEQRRVRHQHVARVEEPPLHRFVAGYIIPQLDADAFERRPDRGRINELTGIDDSLPAVSESYIQWVMEDRFPEGRIRDLRRDPVHHAVGKRNLTIDPVSERGVTASRETRYGFSGRVPVVAQVVA